MPSKTDASKRTVNKETYLHRIGRTARYGRTGVAISFVCSDQDLEFLKEIQEHYGI